MKTLKDKFVSDNLWYLVLAYMHDTEFRVVESGQNMMKEVSLYFILNG